MRMVLLSAAGNEQWAMSESWMTWKRWENRIRKLTSIFKTEEQDWQPFPGLEFSFIIS